MRQAFVLIRSDPGVKGEILNTLEEIPEVVEAHKIYGIYDIIIRIKAETIRELKDVLLQRIRCLDKVRSTLTMICMHPGSGE